MSTTCRLLRTSGPFQLPSPSISSSCIESTTARYQIRCRASLSSSVGDSSNTISDKKKGENRKPVVQAVMNKASIATTTTTTTTTTSQPDQGLLNLASIIITSIRNATLLLLRDINAKNRSRKLYWRRSNLQPQMLIERAIVDCRFFTLFAVAGSLLGSVLCFFQGCLLVIESYAHYFHMLSQRLELDQGHLVHLLIEAIDMFMVGTALLIFGVSLYVMFVGSTRTTSTSKEKEPWLCGSNLFGLFYMKSPPRWVGMQSIEQAKSKIGHAVMMILQVGLIEKFKNIPLVTGVDLACFAAAILTSSASIFVLSRIHHRY